MEDFSLFSSVVIKAGQVFGYISGELKTEDYSHKNNKPYPTVIKYPIFIDSSEKLTLLNFLKSDPSDYNVQKELIPINNRWYHMYRALRDIQPDEELKIASFTKYGFNHHDFQE